VRTQQINRVTAVVLVVLSLTALITVATGLIWPPPKLEPDEGAQAHIFQLSIAGLVPVTVAVLGTADWRHAWRSLQPVVIAFLSTVLAFAGLYYLEHFR
jgi:hypothetical protein